MNIEQEVAILRREMDDVLDTIKSLITRTGELEKTLAVISQNITYIKDGQDRLLRTVSKLFWGFLGTIATVFITTFTAWVLSGGLTR